jgi:hypothetical protein
MKVSKIVMSGGVIAALVLGASQLGFAPQPPKTDKNTKDKPAAPAAPAAGQPDHEKMMEEVMKYAEPGPEHKQLAAMVGTWDCAAKFNMPGPDGKMQEMTSKGEATIVSELGGRWFRQDFKGDMMGSPFAGIGHSGYDRYKKKYIATWMDTMGTGLMLMEGTYDDATKTLTMQGSYDMPGMGQVKARHTTVQKDPNTVVFTMYSTMAGMPESKEGEITYTRRK